MNDTRTPVALADQALNRIVHLSGCRLSETWASVDSELCTCGTREIAAALRAALRDHAAQDLRWALNTALNEWRAYADPNRAAWGPIGRGSDDEAMLFADCRAALTGSPATPELSDEEHIARGHRFVNDPDGGHWSAATPTPRPVADGLDVDRLAQAISNATVFPESDRG